MSRGKTNTKARSATARSTAALPIPKEVSALKINRVRTAKGVAVDLNYNWEIDIGGDPAWSVHILEATVEGKPAGYLKISYIPRKQMERLIPTAFDYATYRSGSFLGIKHLLKDKSEELWDDKDLIKAINESYQWIGGYRGEIKLEEQSTDELRQLWKKRKQFINREYKKSYEEFKDFHLDKPQIDFIEVYQPKEKWRYVDGEGVEFEDQMPEFRRQGIGSALYEVGAKWMQANKMKLWASTVQTDDAKATWKNLQERKLAKEYQSLGLDKPRLYLEPNLIKLNIPEKDQA